MAHKVIVYALPVAVGWAAAVGFLAMARTNMAQISAATKPDFTPPIAALGNMSPTNGDNAELWSMTLASQNEHMQNVPKLRLPANVVAQRDDLRIDRVRRMYQAGLLVTAKDYYNGAVIMQRGHSNEDLLLAHDMAVLALSMGLKRATWLTAETEDKFLISMGRPQRFATQYESVQGGFPKLSAVDPTVTDAHRLEMGSVTLSEAQRKFGTPGFTD